MTQWVEWVKQALASAHIPSILEPQGLVRSDNKLLLIAVAHLPVRHFLSCLFTSLVVDINL